MKMKEKIEQLLQANKDFIKIIAYLENYIKTQPYVCPVCNGTGKVPAGFYTKGIASTTASPVQCRSCNGTGIVWNSIIKEDETKKG
jgi:RecJ-like exonuclease